MYKKPIKIYFFGDSICFGQYVSTHKTWVVKISEKLSEITQQYGADIIVQNPSISGNTTIDALKRINYDVLAHKPDILLVQFGMNDCNYWQAQGGNPRVGKEEFMANMERIIELAFSAGVKKLFLNTNHISVRDSKLMPHAELTYAQSNEYYNRIIRSITTENKEVVLNDMEEAFKEYGDKTDIISLLLPEPDLVHLSEQGHEFYFSLIYPRIKEAVVEFINQDKELTI